MADDEFIQREKLIKAAENRSGLLLRTQKAGNIFGCFYRGGNNAYVRREEK